MFALCLLVILFIKLYKNLLLVFFLLLVQYVIFLQLVCSNLATLERRFQGEKNSKNKKGRKNKGKRSKVKRKISFF